MPALQEASATTTNQATTNQATHDPATRYGRQQVGEVDVFYRFAGDPDAEVVLLLHGYPSSSHMFRELIPILATKYRVIAPDLPGFGSTTAPPRGAFDYTFDQLADTVRGFIEALGLERFALYVFDYGAPVGLRIAAADAQSVSAIISQNGNVYEQGLTENWAPLRAYWQDGTEQNRDALRQLLARETTQWQYTHGVPESSLARVGPDGIDHDQSILDRPGSDEIQLDLFRDYRTNVELYPHWQRYLRTHRPPVLAIWGKNDPFFAPQGAEAFRRDVPEARVELVDSGHFALESHGPEIARSVLDFLDEVL